MYMGDDYKMWVQSIIVFWYVCAIPPITIIAFSRVVSWQFTSSADKILPRQLFPTTDFFIANAQIWKFKGSPWKRMSLCLQVQRKRVRDLYLLYLILWRLKLIYLFQYYLSFAGRITELNSVILMVCTPSPFIIFDELHYILNCLQDVHKVFNIAYLDEKVHLGTLSSDTGILHYTTD